LNLDFREWLGVQIGTPPASILGTTAEIFEYSEPGPHSLEVGLKIKAKGRQRFKVVSSRTQIDGSVGFCYHLELMGREIESPQGLQMSFALIK
jgi:hypothetical protein